ncbi:MAG: dTDP-4-dehydrorhamnose 3,5-epimerase [Trueperaceae bacterium]
MPTFEPLDPPGLLRVVPDVHGDDRGFFAERWSAKDHAPHGIPTLAQVNHSRSARGVVRGLHWQAPPTPQGKLVWVARGAILDVAVDLRSGSPTFGRWATLELTDANAHQLWIPSGFAHGFRVLSDVADVLYGTDAPFSIDADRNVAWNDPDLHVDWGTFEEAQPVLSTKDAAAPRLADLSENDLVPWEEPAASSIHKTDAR